MVKEKSDVDEGSCELHIHIQEKSVILTVQSFMHLMFFTVQYFVVAARFERWYSSSVVLKELEISGCDVMGSVPSLKLLINQDSGGRLLLVFGTMPGLIQHTRGCRTQTSSH